MTTSDSTGGDDRAHPLISPVRYVAAACAAVVATGYLLVMEDQFTAGRLYGSACAAVSVGWVALVALLIRRDTIGVWRAVLGASAATAVLALVALTHLVRIAGDDAGGLASPLLGVCVAAAAVAAATSGVALRPGTSPAGIGLRLVARGRPARVGAFTLVLGLGALGFAASADATAQGAASRPMPMNMPMDMPMTTTMGDSGSGAYWSAVGGAAFRPTGVTRTYFIAADEVSWNYAPSGKNQITGEPFDATANTYVASGPGRIGSTYLKCLYHPYTDAGFATVLKRPADQEYLGLYGPVIRATVGDTIKVVFRNNCRIPASVHPHGVFYQKASEGAPYADNTSGVEKTDDAVPKGGTHTYTWLVPERAGPGPHDGSSVMWMYHSHTDEIGDTYAGLMGPMEITRAGMARADGSPKDVDHEVFELYSVMNESKSPYLQTNLEQHAAKPWPAGLDDEEFVESNLMHSINGYVFGNQPMVRLKKGERVRWYVMSMGTEVDLHTPHWHGNDVTVGGMRMDVVALLPAGMVTADMVPDDVGLWLFHCHVNDHLTAGMITRYEVVDKT